MYILDIIILIILIGMCIRGAMRGVIGQIFGILSLFCAVWLSSKYAIVFASWVNTKLALQASPQLMKVLIFVVMFFVILLIGRLLARAMEGVINLSMLGWLNKLLGAIFSLISAFIVLGIILYFFNYVNNLLDLFPTAKLQTSKMYVAIMHCTDTLFPYIKQIF